MILAQFSHWLLERLMRKRAERHAGCRIDLARLRTDPEYASAIRTLAQFTLDEELRVLGASGAGPVEMPAAPPASALVLPFRRQIPA
ncbi:MAG: hypothetical protein JNM90_10565 [Burkholderiales bacterium]|nr:hypothetical protein [Burkholderiales bacterium]